MRLGCEKLQRLREVWVTGLKITSSSKWWEKTIWADHYPLQVRSTPTQLNSSTLCMLWAPHHKAHKGCNRSGKVLRRATRMFKRTEQLLCEEQLWRQGPFCLKKTQQNPKQNKKKLLKGIWQIFIKPPVIRWRWIGTFLPLSLPALKLGTESSRWWFK